MIHVVPLVMEQRNRLTEALTPADPAGKHGGEPTGYHISSFWRVDVSAGMRRDEPIYAGGSVKRRKVPLALQLQPLRFRYKITTKSRGISRGLDITLLFCPRTRASHRRPPVTAAMSAAAPVMPAATTRRFGLPRRRGLPPPPRHPDEARDLPRGSGHQPRCCAPHLLAG